MIIEADAIAWAEAQPSKSIDHIITDYEYGTFFPFDEFIRICKGTILTFSSNKDLPMGNRWTEKAVWIKTPSTKNYKRRLGRFVEDIYVYKQNKYDIFNADLHWSNYTGVYTDLVEEKGWYWKKPLSLMERLIRIYTMKGDTVLDPYCGSGTTLEAAKKWDRHFIGIDIDPKWVEYCNEKFTETKSS